MTMTETLPTFTTADGNDSIAFRETVADVASRGFSPVGYAVCREIAFRGARVVSVTFHAMNEQRTRTAVVETTYGRTTFTRRGGVWADSQNVNLTAIDDAALTAVVDHHVDYFRDGR